MAVRNVYTSRDERLMWEHIFKKLQEGDEAAYQPKGLKLWKTFEATQKTNKTASSLATHFRKAMYDHIEEAKIPVEQQLYIASQLNLKLSRRQQKTIEYKENISITVDGCGFVTAYEKEGKQYLPSLLKKGTLCEDNNINDELGYDAFELNGSMRKIPKLSQSFDRSSASLGLRKRLNVGNNRSPAIRNSKEVEAVDLMLDNDHNDNRNEEFHGGGNQNEISCVGQMLDDGNGNVSEQKKVCENAETITYEKQFSSNKTDDQETSKSRRVLCVADGSHNSSKETEMNIFFSKNEICNFQSEALGNQAECETAESESGMSQCIEVVDNIKNLAVHNDQFDMKMMSNEISKSVACNSTSIQTTTLMKGREELLAESIIDEELKQLLAFISNKRQLRGVEKMKTEKILELRAKEAKQLGIGLRSYLRKMRQQMI
uniref:Bm10871 n=1 Tax=Brugia malayi TaxID=6279 RepID=A0A0H5SB00_BRUMA|nr:Bm10871 [Brugia malayi]